MYCKSFEFFLADLFFHHFYLHRAGSDESVADHWPHLAYAMTTSLSLSVHVRVPVTIEQNDGIRSSKIDALFCCDVVRRRG